MSEPSTVARDATLPTLRSPTSSPADFRAKTSPSPGQEEDSTASDPACGGSSTGSLAFYDPDTSSWRTYQLSFAGDSTLSADDWPRTGMMRSGRLYPQRRWVPRTFESESSWWPTPAAWDATDREVPDDAYVTETGTVRARYGDDHSSNLGLQGTVKGRERWPTPAAQDAKNSTLPPSQRNRDTLPGEMIRRTWPTPQARDGTPRGAQAKRYLDPERSNDLPDAVDHAEQKSGQLNPMWTAWLMGFPIGWTEREPSGTP